MKATPLFVAVALLCPVVMETVAGQPVGFEDLPAPQRRLPYFIEAPAHVQHFLETYRATAMQAGAQWRVPASIILAVSALESSYGSQSSKLVRDCNNFFGIKTRTNTVARCCKEVTEYRGAMVRDSACFRSYERPEDSFWDFCRLMHRPRFRSLTLLPRWEYRAWAEGLQEAVYATDPAYADKLIRIIERYELHRLDPRPLRRPLPPVLPVRLVRSNNR